jgi:hypothetical protein
MTKRFTGEPSPFLVEDAKQINSVKQTILGSPREKIGAKKSKTRYSGEPKSRKLFRLPRVQQFKSQLQESK